MLFGLKIDKLGGLIREIFVKRKTMKLPEIILGIRGCRKNEESRIETENG